jgi:hypothetical protein
MDAMIKLKTLLEDVIRGGFWKTSGDTPSAVVDVLHLIVAEIIKKRKHYEKYVSIYEKKFPQIGKCWVIGSIKRPMGSLVYSTVTEQWYSMALGFDVKMPISDVVLNAIIKKWGEWPND